MKRRLLASTIVPALMVGCGGGPPSPPSLAYAMPASEEVRYDYGDTTLVSINAMGQSMELSLRGTAEYDVRFSPQQSGVGVTMSVASLSATINQPMGSPLQIDEGDVDGELAFSLDRRGNPVLTSQPDVSEAASQMLSGLAMAHGFFPGLPGRAVAPGESWVDTISYEGEDGAGARSELSIFRYTVAGDTTIAGRTLLAISLEGTTEVSNEMEVGGMAISQSSDLTVEGMVLWDLQNAVMYEGHRRGTGSGTVAVPIAPVPLPIQIETTQRARLQGM